MKQTMARSLSIYRRLARAFPEQFQRAHGQELLQTTETNQLGRFTFLGLRAGTYELAARDVRPGEMTPTRQVGVPSPTGEYDLHYA